MVDTGIVQKLLELLDRHVEEGNVTVQHAALSALRNLAIPGEQQSDNRRSKVKLTFCFPFSINTSEPALVSLPVSLTSGEQIQNAGGRSSRRGP